MEHKQFTILVVDDEQVNILLLTAILKKQGYLVETAENGIKAREMAISKRPDLILLDVMMPGEDGFETCRKLKADPVTTEIPVVFISAMDDLESKVKGLTIGGWDYIAKPFQKEEIIARVRNYLKLRFAFQRVIEEQAKRLQQIRDAQEAILVKPEDVPGARFGVQYLPVLEAGGDFYDVFELYAGVHGYFVADISGHDMGASFATSALKALIRQNSSQLYSPDETIRIINSILTTIFSEGQHLTAVYAYLNRATGTLAIVNAAHLPVLLQPATGEPVLLEADGDVLGAFESGYYSVRQVAVRPGDRFYLYSDGLVEIFETASQSRELGIQKLIAAVKDAGHLEIGKAVRQITRAMFADGRQPEDDVLLLGVEI